MKNILFNTFAHKHYKAYKLAEKNQWMSESEIHDLQNNKLGQLCKFLSKNNDYYRALGIGEIDSIEKLRWFPFLTKQIIIDNFEQIKSRNLPKKRFVKSSTSGSTGQSLYFFIDGELRNDGWGMRSDAWTGFRPGESSIYIWGADRDTKMTIKRRIKNSKLFYNKSILSSYHMTIEDIDRYTAIINRQKPKMIVGYPSTLEYFAQRVLDSGMKIHSPKSIVATGETLYDFQKNLISEAFKTKTFNRYASREVDVIAAECQFQCGLHINSDHVIVELLNESGEQCKENELGELVITDLDNYVFPFINYKIGDLGIRSSKQCPCGRAFPLLAKIEGRSFDLVIGSNGNRVPGNFFTLLRNKIKGIQKFQLIQKKIGLIQLMLQINSAYNLDEEFALRKMIKEKLGEDTVLDIIYVEEIPKTATGKHKWIISEVSPFNIRSTSK